MTRVLSFLRSRVGLLAGILTLSGSLLASNASALTPEETMQVEQIQANEYVDVEILSFFEVTTVADLLTEETLRNYLVQINGALPSQSCEVDPNHQADYLAEMMCQDLEFQCLEEHSYDYDFCSDVYGECLGETMGASIEELEQELTDMGYDQEDFDQAQNEATSLEIQVDDGEFEMRRLSLESCDAVKKEVGLLMRSALQSSFIADGPRNSVLRLGDAYIMVRGTELFFDIKGLPATKSEPRAWIFMDFR